MYLTDDLFTLPQLINSNIKKNKNLSMSVN
jgi:hypothetical protein